MKTLTFAVQGMTCVVCSRSVEKALMALPSAQNVSVNFASGKAVITYDEKSICIEDIMLAVRHAGYTPVMLDAPQKKNKDFGRVRLILSFCIGMVLLAWTMLPMAGVPYPDAFSPDKGTLVFATVQLILCLPVVLMNTGYYVRGFGNLIRLKPNMDSLIAVSTTAAFVYSMYNYVRICLGVEGLGHSLYFESVTVIIALISLGKYLEGRSLRRTGDAIAALTALAPKTATVIRQGLTLTISAQDVVPGDEVIVKAGESFCCDGVIVRGTGEVNESMLTGESMPVDKKEGDKVYGGTVNGSSVLVFSAVSVGADTALAHIIRTVEEAQNSKAPIARLADKVSGVFVPAVMSIAVIAATAWGIAGKSAEFCMSIFVAVLVIACPCALGLATPTAIITGTGRAARVGVLFKNAEALQALAGVNCVVFDKTGTITQGSPHVTQTEGERDIVLAYAAGVEKFSTHPLAVAICDEAERSDIKAVEISDVKNFAGSGIGGKCGKGEVLVGKPAFLEQEGAEVAEWKDIVSDMQKSGKTVVGVSVNKKVIGVIGLEDLIKDSAKDTVAELKQLGMTTVLLTGDNEYTAQAVAQAIGIEKVVAQVLPDGKADSIRQLQAQGYKCIMVGDGINDAPALASADVGAAIGAGSDTAVESAGVVFVGNNVSAITDAILISKATMRNVRENLFWAFIYNIIGIPFAAGAVYAMGGILLSPMIAALAMSLSSVSVVSNALRLSAYKPGKVRNAMARKRHNDNEQSKENNIAASISDDLSKAGYDENNTLKEQYMEQILNVEGMMCSHCEARVSAALKALPGVSEVTASAKDKKVVVKFDEGKVSVVKLKETITQTGYEVKD